MNFYYVFLLFVLIVFASLLWPLFRGWRDQKKELRSDARSDFRDAVVLDRQKELEETHAMGEISETEFNSLQKDLEKTLSAQASVSPDAAPHAISFGKRSRNLLFAMCVLIPLFSFVAYTQLGAKADWQIAQASAELQAGGNGNEEDKLALIEQVKSRIEATPENGHLYFLLGSLSSQVGDFEESVRAYRTLKEMHPDSPVVIAELAQSLFLRAGNVITPEVKENTLDALELDPNLPTALGFAGIDAFQNGRYQAAIDFWQRAVTQLDPSSAASQFLSQGIARAKLALEKSGGAEEAESKVTENASIRVSVALGEKVQGLSGNETVFVYARAWQGAKMPLAIQRIPVSSLPTKLSLNKDMAMAQGMDITSAPQLEVVARISKAGTASPQSGDWMTSFGPVILVDGAADAELTISEQIP